MKALEFTGSGSEYFKIWIVNILLTIVTLGIYLPWAKVRNKRYFYGNTLLGSHNFDYHATGKQLFLSYLIAMTIFILVSALSNFNPIFAVISAIVFVLVMPWIVWKSLQFSRSMISYRNVRFGFSGSLGGSYATFLAWPIGALIMFALLVAVTIMLGDILALESISMAIVGLLFLFFYPSYFAFINKVSGEYVINGSQFGQGQFATKLRFRSLLKIVLKGIGLGILLALIVIVIIGAATYFTIGAEGLLMVNGQLQAMGQGEQPGLLFMAVLVGAYLVLGLISIYVASYFKARNQSYIFNETILDKSIYLQSTVSTNGLFIIIITNILLLLFTLGLAYPWTQVRKHRYLMEHISVDSALGLDGFVSKMTRNSSFGEELGEAFDVDMGAVGF